MTDPAPACITAFKSASASRYGSGTGGCTAVLGSVPAGTLVVAALMSSDVSRARGTTMNEPLIVAGGGNYAATMHYAGQGQRSDVLTVGFFLAWYVIPALWANDPTLSVGTLIGSSGSWNVVTDVQVVALRGADPNGQIVAGCIDVGGYSTPAVQAAAPGIAVHAYCAQQYGQVGALETLAGGPFGTLEEDDTYPGAMLQLSVGSYVENVLAGPTTPRRVSINPWANWGTLNSDNAYIRSAVLTIPHLRGDSAGDLVT